ncbi:hypothetical protein [Parasitella parasitica]|uniref:Peroxisomal membrane protein PEX13 n=1 Tax=Parasitella parasitica TaxID=35722 RepID=A0A0B7NHS2_9FUNG|nr:hypothetical protein [Parasitella parasitica]
MPSPPKPWEVNNNNGAAAVVTSPAAAAAASLTTNAPDVPARSSTATADISSMTTPARPASYNTTGYGTMGYGSTGYGSTGYGSTGYGSMGGYGSTGYGGYGSYGRYGNSYGGGYGSSYGGYGSGYGSLGYGGGYGMNRYGGGGFGRMGGPGGPDEMGLTQRMEMGTRPAFEVVENIVGSFGGFAQMLESTFMATHSSFMAMVGVAEQLGFLKNYLGQVFSLLAIYRFVRRIVDKVTGRAPAAKPMEMNLMEFQNFESKAASRGPKMSRKPLIIFFLMVVGLPYMMHKLIKLITASQQKQMAVQGVPGALNNASATAAGAGATAIDPSKLEFARAMYDFTAESQMELNLKKGDIVAIISKVDPATNATSQWWRGRLRDGTMGMFPANYVEIIQKGGPAASNNNAVDDAANALKETAPAAITASPTAETQTTKLV